MGIFIFDCTVGDRLWDDAQCTVAFLFGHAAVRYVVRRAARSVGKLGGVGTGSLAGSDGVSGGRDAGVRDGDRHGQFVVAAGAGDR